ncbi:MAG: hypothetical protein CSA68_01630 [Rhodobacterales bacterium]|nr:MAG: hypothetical protein CSA68_01630 [Rhodobacterales bacterium]
MLLNNPFVLLLLMGLAYVLGPSVLRFGHNHLKSLQKAGLSAPQLFGALIILASLSVLAGIWYIGQFAP